MMLKQRKRKYILFSCQTGIDEAANLVQLHLSN